MSNNNEQFYYHLDYTHEELESLFDKLHDGFVLSQEQYDKILEILGMYISDFDGDYESLENKPFIPANLSELVNDMTFQTAEELNMKLVVLKDFMVLIQLIASTTEVLPIALAPFNIVIKGEKTILISLKFLNF